jgi:HPt (histidine-containing phosphotransfer) domain-containing protein
MQDRPRRDRTTPLVSQYAADPEMAELVQLFISELPVRINALKAAWTEARISDLRRMAHQLKGSCGGYGFPSIGEAAEALEAGLKTTPGADTQAVLDGLAAEFRALVELCSRAAPGR